MPRVLRRFGVNPEEIFAEVGIAADLLDDPDNRISFRERAHLLRTCVERTGCEHLGLLIGQQSSLSSLGIVGYLVLNSPDVESALNSLVSYFRLHSEGSLIMLEVKESFAFLGYSIYQEQVEAGEQLTDAAAIMLNVLQQLCGTDWSPSEVTFAHREPADTKPFKKFFKARMRFDAQASGVFFPAEWLQRSVKGADPELHRLIEKQVEALGQLHGENFPEQVRRFLSGALLANHSGIEQVAAAFSIHSRTLHRRLKSHGTSFQEIADECRFDIAQQLLRNPEATQAQLADMLGYSDARSFNRAFKRWSGMSPSQWRLSTHP